MADDDGLLMNFSLTDAPRTVAPIFKGGHWRDRLRAKQDFRRWQSQVAKSAKATQEPQVETQERPTKMPKLAQSQDEAQGRKAHINDAPREVVSSLFTSNPQPASKPSQTKEDLDQEVVPSNAPLLDGLDTFLTLGLSKPLATNLLVKLNLKAPTSIQKSAISQLVTEDSDAFIQAETGSGKTLAYLLPIVQRIMMLSSPEEQEETGEQGVRLHRDSGLFAIILAPTRELAKQILVVLESLLQCAHWLVAGLVIGGESKKSEKARLRKGLNILVATPGRLADHLSNTKALDVSQVRWLVLDEGDRLMELGFEEEIKQIVSKLNQQHSTSSPRIPRLPSRRTTVLCSATLKTNVQRLGDISLKDAVHIKSDTQATWKDGNQSLSKEGFSAPAQLKQSFIVVPAKQRFVTLFALLKQNFARKGSVMKAIVFISCADSVDFHFAALTRSTPEDAGKISADEKSQNKASKELPTVASSPLLSSSSNPNLTLYKLYGSLSQPLRTSTLSSFARNTDPAILLCTDVASRGLDLPSIDLVVEYDPPFSSDDHLHRIGRTARAGRNGRATIFLMPGPEEGYVEVLKRSYSDEAGVRITQHDADTILQRGFAKAASSTSDPQPKNQKWPDSSWQEDATAFQLSMEQWLLSDAKHAELARKAYKSHVAAYATHEAAERTIFDIKSMHLGHLAKAFALRERPGHMGRGDTGDKKAKRGKLAKRVHGGKKQANGTGEDDEDWRTAAQVDQADASRKMRAGLKRHMDPAMEFNIA